MVTKLLRIVAVEGIDTIKQSFFQMFDGKAVGAVVQIGAVLFCFGFYYSNRFPKFDIIYSRSIFTMSFI